jgi:hypothetical protein
VILYVSLCFRMSWPRHEPDLDQVRQFRGLAMRANPVSEIHVRGPPGRAALFGFNCGSSGSRHTKKRAQFVAIGIAKVNQIHGTGPTLAHARRVLDRCPAIRDAGFVPGIGLF